MARARRPARIPANFVYAYRAICDEGDGEIIFRYFLDRRVADHMKARPTVKGVWVRPDTGFEDEVHTPEELAEEEVKTREFFRLLGQEDNFERQQPLRRAFRAKIAAFKEGL